MELTKHEMYEVTGGVSWAVVSGVIAGIIYIIGVVSGYTNPTRCNN